jgi:DNA-binding transcriptional regulator LsrR (DeoR family)
MKNRTLSISADVYKKINNKVVVTCGSNRSTAVKSLLTGHMANVLIIDYYLATELVKEENEVY